MSCEKRLHESLWRKATQDKRKIAGRSNCCGEKREQLKGSMGKI